MRFLCIFAVPRTGSSHLDKLFRSCPEFNVKSELFHPQHVGVLKKKELAALNERSVGAVTDAESFKQWRCEHPWETLEALHESGGKRIVVFKVFPNHLTKGMLDAELFPRTEIAFAVLRRRPIESFISSLKAQSVSRYGFVETTTIKPSLRIEEFWQWGRRAQKWYKFTCDALEARGAPYAQISYGKHLNGLSGQESLEKVLSMLEPLGIPGISIPGEILEGKRQDNELRYQDRVDNWDSFVEEAQSDPDHARLLQWALTDP